MRVGTPTGLLEISVFVADRVVLVFVLFFARAPFISISEDVVVALFRVKDEIIPAWDGVSRVAVERYSVESYVIVLTTTPVITHTWLFSISDNGQVVTQHT
jgi:hypothetical protein